MADRQRIFIALRPDLRTCKSLVEIQRRISISGRMIPPESLHLTLAFLGDCDSDRRKCVLDKITDVNANAFNMQFGEFGYFERHHIFYMAPNIISVELLSLHKQLCRTLSPCRFKTPRVFKPHVTLYRGVRTPPFCKPLDTVVQWQVDSIYVERSELNSEGAHYTTIKKQPLPAVDG